MRYYVVVDVGCLHCGERSAVIGIFLDEEESIRARDAYEPDLATIHGEHRVMVLVYDRAEWLIERAQ